jgi:molybdopterin converting factor small subunit
MTVRVKCMGHIKTSLGREAVELPGEMSAGELIDTLRRMAESDPHVGFNRFNTLLVVNGESAFTAASNDRKLHDGDEVFLVPFSHGG